LRLPLTPTLSSQAGEREPTAFAATWFVS
jgi:hypothetical protein